MYTITLGGVTREKIELINQGQFLSIDHEGVIQQDDHHRWLTKYVTPSIFAIAVIDRTGQQEEYFCLVKARPVSPRPGTLYDLLRTHC